MKNREGRESLSLPSKAGFITRKKLVFAIAIIMSLFHIYTAGVRPLPGVQQRVMHLAFALSLIFLIFPFRPKSDEINETKVTDEERRLSLIDIGFVLLSFFLGFYVMWEWEALAFRTGMPNFMDNLVSVLGILLVLEATRRVIGWPIIIISFVGFAYVAFGGFLPSFVAHAGFSFEQVINFLFFSTEGVLGLPLGLSSTVIIVFIIFGAFIFESGAGGFFIDMALSLFGKYRGGPAKAGVMGSCMFGAITGSQVANVTSVGVLTIPLMKKVGYKPIVAASIEALSSTGAMLMPPVMGAVAFIIPEMIGGTYWDVCKAAFIPALLLYTSVYMIVELQSRKYGLSGLKKSELPNIKKVFMERGHMLLPVIVLIFCVAVLNMSTTRAGFWSIVTVLVVSQLRPGTRMNLKKITTALQRGAKGTLIVAACCASAGLITGAISITGMGIRFSDVLITVAGGSMFILLFLTMIASLIMGLPLPPITCYLILAVLAAPALVKAGVNPMAAHLFVFFFGALGNISPPVAPTSFAASAIAETNPMKTTNLTFLYSLPAFLVPYMYVYSNELLFMGSPLSILIRIITAFLGIGSMSVTFHGYFIRNLNWTERILFLFSGLILVYPHWLADIIGYLMIGALIFYLYMSKSKNLEKVHGKMSKSLSKEAS